jgi:hypothetical protein
VSNKPATSTHLGRGDHWNIPSTCTTSARQNWEKKAATYYQAGKKRLTAKIAKEYMAALAPCEPRIPAVFLEALTFEGKFSAKVLSSMK